MSEFYICARPMKRVKTDRRPVPITCHHVALGHLLQYLPRVLCEMVEEYRVSLFDKEEKSDDSTRWAHDCGEDEYFHCPLKDIDILAYRYPKMISIHICHVNLHQEMHWFRPGLPLLQLARRAVGDRLPCDVLAAAVAYCKPDTLYYSAELNLITLEEFDRTAELTLITVDQLDGTGAELVPDHQVTI